MTPLIWCQIITIKFPLKFSENMVFLVSKSLYKEVPSRIIILNLPTVARGSTLGFRVFINHVGFMDRI